MSKFQKDEEVTERLTTEKKASDKKPLIYVASVLVVVFIIVLLLFLNYHGDSPIVSIPFLDNLFGITAAVDSEHPLGEDESFNDITAGLGSKSNVLQGNTTGNLGNYGKVVTVGNTNYISVFQNNINHLYEQKDNKLTKLFSNENPDNGINDLQYYNKILYLKVNGLFGSFDFNSKQFVHISLKPDKGTPISPRIYNGKVYYITYDQPNQFYLYEANLDGSESHKISNLDEGLRLLNFTAFTIKEDTAYLFINTVIGNYKRKESKIEAISLKDNTRQTIYTTNCYIDEFISASGDNLYYLESDSQDNTQKSIYQIPFEGGSPTQVVSGVGRDITTINSNEKNLYFLDSNTLYRSNLDGSDITEIGHESDSSVGFYDTDKKTFLLLSDKKIFLEIKGMDTNYITRTVLYEVDIDNPDSFHEVPLP